MMASPRAEAGVAEAGVAEAGVAAETRQAVAALAALAATVRNGTAAPMAS